MECKQDWIPILLSFYPQAMPRTNVWDIFILLGE